jgi:hypothetical protein
MEALERVDSIPGWLRPGDADKLWELAGSANGPILEIGCHKGKSAVLMALAARDAGRDTSLYTLDVDRDLLDEARGHALAHGVGDRIELFRGTAGAFAGAYPQLRPALTFVDGDHRREGVERDLRVLAGLVPDGGLLLFHDFDDPLNEDPACEEVDVRTAVEGSWVARECAFLGTFGCCGLFARRAGGAEPAQAPVVDLMRLDGPIDQYRHRLRYPVGRLLRRLRRQWRSLRSSR